MAWIYYKTNKYPQVYHKVCKKVLTYGLATGKMLSKTGQLICTKFVYKQKGGTYVAFLFSRNRIFTVSAIVDSPQAFSYKIALLATTLKSKAILFYLRG